MSKNLSKKPQVFYKLKIRHKVGGNKRGGRSKNSVWGLSMLLQYINFDHRLFRRVRKTRNLIFFTFKLQNENFWIWIWISYGLKEFETFIFDENFLKARDSTASMYRETHFRSFEPFLYCIKYFFLLE